jgi:hypothetical protein
MPQRIQVQIHLDNPMATTDPDFAAAAQDFKRGGWVVSLLGGAGMLARMLIDDETHPIIYWVKKIVAGAIVGVITYFALYGTELSGLHKSIIMSTAGAGSPELMQWIKKRFSKGLTDEKETKASRKRKRK